MNLKFARRSTRDIVWQIINNFRIWVNCTFYWQISRIKICRSLLWFLFLVSSIKQPPPDYDGKVNVMEFWEFVSLEMVSRGLVPSKYKCCEDFPAYQISFSPHHFLLFFPCCWLVGWLVLPFVTLGLLFLTHLHWQNPIYFFLTWGGRSGKRLICYLIDLRYNDNLISWYRCWHTECFVFFLFFFNCHSPVYLN